MLDDIYRIRDDRVTTVKWYGDELLYDLQLYELGEGQEEFWCWNPEVENQDLRHYIKEIPYSRKCIVWTYNGEWIVKLFKEGWYPYHGYETFEIKRPTFIWTKNPDLDKLMTFQEDPFRSFEPDPWDSNYKLVWYIDPRVNPTVDKVWALSCTPIGKEVLGVKDMGYVMPDIDVEYSEHLPDLGIDIDQCYPAFWELDHELAWELDPIHLEDDQMWVIKFCPNYRKPKGWKWYGTITPQVHIEYNPDLPNLEYDLDYVIPWHDLAYEHVWMLDNKHLKNSEEEIWAFKIRVTNDVVGTSIIDYISPNINITFNEDLPRLKYNLDYVIPWHDLAYEHVWMLDNEHLKNGEEEIWAVKISATEDPEGTTFIDYISPIASIETNPLLKDMDFHIDHIAPWHDLKYEMVWMLDPAYYVGHDPIWAVKQKYISRPAGSTEIGIVEPIQTIKFNKALKNLYIEIDYKIPLHDKTYEHIWYTDIDGENVWASKLATVKKPKGVKEMGIVTPMIPRQLDVVFISYKESNAEENWHRLLEFAPNAKRVQGVKGILNAHKAAAKISSTDMFYVVDGDAWIVDGWTFDFQPNLYDRDCAYVWSSKNPVNDLTYQNGGVKLFNKRILMQQGKWTTLDMFTGIMPKIKSESKISCITKFNVDKFSTWRSAFRECVKLYKTNQMSKLDKWIESNPEREFGEYAAQGALHAYNYAKEFLNDQKALLRINDYEWLEQQFKELNE
jgi:hypothetical protein